MTTVAVGAPVRTRAQVSTRTLAAAVVVAAFVLRAAVVLATRSMPVVDDPADYHRLGVSLAHGHGFGDTVLAAGGGPTAFRPPLYPLFLGTVFRVSGDSVLAARLLQAVLGAVAVALLGLVAHRVAGRRVALVAMAIAAVYPPLILVGTPLLSESLSIPLLLGALAAALEYRRDERLGWALGAGVLVGLGILNRPVSAVFAVPAALLTWTAPRLRLRALTAPLAVAAVAGLTVLPWTLRNAARFHAFVPVSTLDGFVVAGVFNAQADSDPHAPAAFRPPTAVPELAPAFRDASLDEAELSDVLQSHGTAYLRAHPGYLVESVVRNSLRLFDLDGRSFARVAAASLGFGPRAADIWLASYAAVALAAVAGAATRRARAVPPAVWLAPILVVAGTVVMLGTLRYRAPVEPFLVLLAACAVTALWDRRERA